MLKFGCFSNPFSFFVSFARSFENWAYGASPLLYPPHRGEERIKAFPLDGERLDRGESLLHMPPFSSSVGERKIMNRFVVNRKTLVEHHGGGCTADQRYDNLQ
jgi:hypothetical protein